MFCKYCGAKVPEENQYCSNCGKRVRGSAAKKTESLSQGLPEKMPDDIRSVDYQNVEPSPSRKDSANEEPSGTKQTDKKRNDQTASQTSQSETSDPKQKTSDNTDRKISSKRNWLIFGSLFLVVCVGLGFGLNLISSNVKFKSALDEWSDEVTPTLEEYTFLAQNRDKDESVDYHLLQGMKNVISDYNNKDLSLKEVIEYFNVYDPNDTKYGYQTLLDLTNGGDIRVFYDMIPMTYRPLTDFGDITTDGTSTAYVVLEPGGGDEDTLEPTVYLRGSFGEEGVLYNNKPDGSKEHISSGLSFAPDEYKFHIGKDENSIEIHPDFTSGGSAGIGAFSSQDLKFMLQPEGLTVSYTAPGDSKNVTYTEVDYSPIADLSDSKGAGNYSVASEYDSLPVMENPNNDAKQIDTLKGGPFPLTIYSSVRYDNGELWFWTGPAYGGGWVKGRDNEHIYLNGAMTDPLDPANMTSTQKAYIELLEEEGDYCDLYYLADLNNDGQLDMITADKQNASDSSDDTLRSDVRFYVFEGDGFTKSTSLGEDYCILGGLFTKDGHVYAIEIDYNPKLALYGFATDMAGISNGLDTDTTFRVVEYTIVDGELQKNVLRSDEIRKNAIGIETAMNNEPLHSSKDVEEYSTSDYTGVINNVK